MERKFIIMASNASKEQADWMTSFFNLHTDFKVWHWVDNVWILTTPNGYYTPQKIWELTQLGAKGILGVCFEVHGKAGYFGVHQQACWDWLNNNWNPPS